MLCQIGFESFCKFTPREHDPPTTAFALKPNIRTEARDDPLVGTTRMLFSEAEVIVEV
jgi:hypothetical protein